MKTQKQTYREFIALKSIFYFCSLPLRLDSYKGCTHNCLYCFSSFLSCRNYDFFKSPIPADPKRLLNIFISSQSTKSNLGTVKSCIQHKVPIHFGSVSDPFQPIEKTKRVSLEIIKILQTNNYPTLISTKGTLIATPIYLEQIKNFPVSVQISFSTMDDNFAKRIEPNAPPPSERLKTLEVLSKAGIFTTVRCQPFLFPIENIENLNFKRLAAIGVKHVTLEHLRLPIGSSIEARKKLFQALDLDLLSEYKKLGVKKSRINYELSSDIKIVNILKAKHEVNKLGMSFGSADNDFHHMSDSPCCCGLPDIEEFRHYYKGHIGFSIHKSHSNGEISFSNIINEWQPKGSIKEFVNSNSQRKDNITVQDFLFSAISEPSHPNSPLIFWGINHDGDHNYFYDEKKQEYLNKDHIKNENK